jgi:putative spermidine/putrescine transport system permease protein
VIRGIAVIYGVYLLLPIALLIVGSFGKNWTNTILPSGLTEQWYFDLWKDKAFQRAFRSSLFVALSACAINTVLALPLAYSLYNQAGKGKALASRLISAMPVAVPTITLGFGYMIVFNSDLMPWLGSMPLLIAAHAVHTLPYLTGTLLADLRHLQLDKLEQFNSFLPSFFLICVTALLVDW